MPPARCALSDLGSRPAVGGARETIRADRSQRSPRPGSLAQTLRRRCWARRTTHSPRCCCCCCCAPLCLPACARPPSPFSPPPMPLRAAYQAKENAALRHTKESARPGRRSLISGSAARLRSSEPLLAQVGWDSCYCSSRAGGVRRGQDRRASFLSRCWPRLVRSSPTPTGKGSQAYQPPVLPPRREEARLVQPGREERPLHLAAQQGASDLDLHYLKQQQLPAGTLAGVCTTATTTSTPGTRRAGANQTRARPLPLSSTTTFAPRRRGWSSRCCCRRRSNKRARPTGE